jgi:hypothetical protein
MVEVDLRGRPKQSKKVMFAFYSAVFFLIFSILGYLMTNVFLQKAHEEKSDLETKLDEMMTTEKKELEEEITLLKNKINEFSFLLDNQLQSSKIFEFTQRITHPQVWFSNFSLNSERGVLDISGKTQNFETLGQQIFILEDEPVIEKVSLDSFSINEEGKIDFELSLSFEPDFFISKQ